MKTINIPVLPERWQTSDKQVKEMQRAFEFENIVKQIKSLYLGAAKRLGKKHFD